MSTVQSATAASVKLPQIATSSSLWNNRIVVIGGLAVGSLVLLYLLIRRCLGESKGAQNGPPAALNAQGEKDTFLTPSAAGIVVIPTGSSGIKSPYENPLIIDYDLIKVMFTYEASSCNNVAFIDKLPLGKTVKATIIQFPIERDTLSKPVELEVKDDMCVYTINGIATRNIEISRTPKTLTQKVSSPHTISNHTIDKPLAISISSECPLVVYDIDHPEKKYNINNSTDKIHVLFFEILGSDKGIIKGKQQVSVPIVVLPNETILVSQNQFLQGWRCAYANWKVANYPGNYDLAPGSPQLQLLSIQDMTLCP